MLPKSADTQFHTPTLRGSADVLQQPVFAEQANDNYGAQTRIRLELKELFHDQADPTKVVIDTSELVDDARTFANPAKEKIVFADIEPLLTHIGNWMAFNRKEVTENGE
jgi:hypothetical protein